MSSEQTSATGLRVLAVEDDVGIAFMVEEMLEALGHQVVASADTLAGALEAAGTDGFDIAVLDVNLHGLEAYPVASLLEERGIPFLFATGYGPDGVGEWKNRATILTKPFSVAQLGVAIRSALEGRPEQASEPALSLYELGDLLIGKRSGTTAIKRSNAA